MTRDEQIIARAERLVATGLLVSGNNTYTYYSSNTCWPYSMREALNASEMMQEELEAWIAGRPKEEATEPAT